MSPMIAFSRVRERVRERRVRIGQGKVKEEKHTRETKNMLKARTVVTNSKKEKGKKTMVKNKYQCH